MPRTLGGSLAACASPFVFGAFPGLSCVTEGKVPGLLQNVNVFSHLKFVFVFLGKVLKF